MTAWYVAASNVASADARDPMAVTAGYASRNTGLTCYDVTDSTGSTASATISATSGGPGVGVITIELPAGRFGGGGYRGYSKVVRLLNQTDVARFGGDVTNIDATMADTAATYRPLAVWLVGGG